jgi:4-oxalocrotonate tautomerase
MPLISCDMRYGRSDEQKRRLAAGLIRVVGTATGEPVNNIFFVIREGRGINFVEHGEHMPDYVENAAGDRDLTERPK